MKNFFSKFATEWERTVLSCILFLILVYLLFIGYNFLKESENISADSPRAKSPHLFFDTKSMVYLEPAALDKKMNPLEFRIKVTIPPNRNTPVSKKQPQTPKTTPKTQPKTPTPQTGKTGPAQQPKATPPKPKRTISVVYRGYIKGGENKQVAFYSASDSQSKKKENKSASPGSMIHGLLEIKQFDGSQMTVLLGKQEVVIKKGKKQDFNIQ